MSEAKYLLDVNALIALLEPDHMHHSVIQRWFEVGRLDWGVCAFTEAGFLRFATNPKLGSHSVRGATEILSQLAGLSGYRFWPTSLSWAKLVEPFSERVFGHQQMTDAFLLGLAVKEDGVLVTFDKGIDFLAGAKYRKHVLELE